MYEGSDLKRWFDMGALGIVLIGLAVVAVIAAIVVGVVLIVRAESKPSTPQPYGQQPGPRDDHASGLVSRSQ